MEDRTQAAEGLSRHAPHHTAQLVDLVKQGGGHEGDLGDNQDGGLVPAPVGDIFHPSGQLPDGHGRFNAWIDAGKGVQGGAPKPRRAGRRAGRDIDSGAPVYLLQLLDRLSQQARLARARGAREKDIFPSRAKDLHRRE